ncbi:hypothetical protein J1605_007779 [Eschrichtius robustus]|uniref:Uncharacterized protein n=1 Tax=Eschrichtius robustus TaxID=9764 RepID=A0AB34GXP5_ESCRO|nr:hypothetical protein J1605_007779 [Eschrichtius robustus]
MSWGLGWYPSISVTLDCGACRVQGKADYMKEDIKEKKGIREGHKVKFKVKETTMEAVFQHTPVLLCTPMRTCCHPAELSLCQSRTQMAGPAFPSRSQVKQDSLKMLCKADAGEVKVGGVPSTPSHRPLVLRGQVDTLPPQAKMMMTISWELK